MKALALSARGAAALASALVLAAANFAALAAGPALRPQQISPHCWFVQGGAGMATAANAAFNSNAGFCVTAAGVVLIDALGTPALGAALDPAPGLAPACAPASLRRHRQISVNGASSARSLIRVSISSRSGSEPATMPAPAKSRARLAPD